MDLYLYCCAEDRTHASHMQMEHSTTESHNPSPLYDFDILILFLAWGGLWLRLVVKI